MATQDTKEWWERVRGKNRSLKGFISARRRFTARMDRLAGKSPTKRQYSVPAIARRIGSPLAVLKRVIRGQDDAPQAMLVKLAKDLDMPLRELKLVMDEARPQGAARLSLVQRSGSEAEDPFRALEEGLISSARAFVELLRNCSEHGQGRRGRS